MSYIAIVDYGAGNLMSVHTLDFLGCEAGSRTRPRDRGAAGVILPGVGAFPDAMDALHASGLTQAVRKRRGKALSRHLPRHADAVRGSDEVRPCEGLGLLPGHRAHQTRLKLPQIGWNALDILRPNAMTEGVRQGDYVYLCTALWQIPRWRTTSSRRRTTARAYPRWWRAATCSAANFTPKKAGMWDCAC